MFKSHSAFFVNHDDKSYWIECRIVIYRHKFGKHPDFLKKYEGNARDGYNTKFFLLIEDNFKTENDAKAKAMIYSNKYDEIITKAENTGDWSAFPFRTNEIVYYK